MKETRNSYRYWSKRRNPNAGNRAREDFPIKEHMTRNTNKLNRNFLPSMEMVGGGDGQKITRL